MENKRSGCQERGPSSQQREKRRTSNFKIPPSSAQTLNIQKIKKQLCRMFVSRALAHPHPQLSPSGSSSEEDEAPHMAGKSIAAQKAVSEMLLSAAHSFSPLEGDW
ncbi:hypothetical protein EYF80_008893 [Liparis tanakae]|uniref:Uncharacterized protein n=1 Tax=Liparis tanakae TaxID=230148 RepID=A0A4Z2ITH4_9TELE|nr:hypothetical protein EYF80_008893 [Liparis tanakae]